MKSKHFLIFFLRVNLAMILLAIVSHIFLSDLGMGITTFIHHYLYSSLLCAKLNQVIGYTRLQDSDQEQLK